MVRIRGVAPLELSGWTQIFLEMNFSGTFMSISKIYLLHSNYKRLKNNNKTRRVSVLENVAKWDGNMHAIAQRISNKIQNGVAAKIVFVDQVLEEVCVGEQVHTHGTELLHS